MIDCERQNAKQAIPSVSFSFSRHPSDYREIMGEEASSHSTKASDGEVFNDSKGSSYAAPSAAEMKKLHAARKKSAKNLKAKDTEKKTEAVRYCLHDELFLQEPEVLPLIIGLLGRVKVGVQLAYPCLANIRVKLTGCGCVEQVPELVLETLKVFEGLLTGGLPANNPTTTTAVEGEQGEAVLNIKINPEANGTWQNLQSKRRTSWI